MIAKLPDLYLTKFEGKKIGLFQTQFTEILSELTKFQMTSF